MEPKAQPSGFDDAAGIQMSAPRTPDMLGVMAGRVSSPDFVGRRAPEVQPTDREAANQRPPKT